MATGPEALTTSGQHNGQFPWQLDAAPASDLALCAGAEGKSHKLVPHLMRRPAGSTTWREMNGRCRKMSSALRYGNFRDWSLI